MLNKLHEKYHKGQLTLRDYLAAHRTILANDRTWLGNIRTSLAIFVTGVSFMKFFDHQVLQIIGIIFIPIGVLNVVHGFWKYKKRRHLIQSIEKNNDLEKHFDE